MALWSEMLGEPGQVVSAGQTVVRLAQVGPREAVVALPETIRPAIGSVAEASVYGGNGRRYTAHLRQLSDLARPGYAFLTVTLKDSTPPSAVAEELVLGR